MPKLKAKTEKPLERVTYSPAPDGFYSHPRETWDEKECARRARRNPEDPWGNKNPWPGLVASSSSVRPQYGQSQRYNGGCVLHNIWYPGEHVPLPVIPDSYEFVNRPTWGTYIQKKS